MKNKSLYILNIRLFKKMCFSNVWIVFGTKLFLIFILFFHSYLQYHCEYDNCSIILYIEMGDFGKDNVQK